MTDTEYLSLFCLTWNSCRSEKLSEKLWALFKNTVRQTNNPQSPWAKRWQLRHMLKEKRLKSFFGKLGDSKVPWILGNLENHKNAQGRMHSE